MRFQIFETIAIIYILAVPQFYLVSSDGSSSLSKRLYICGRGIPETLRVLCATPENTMINNTGDKRASVRWPNWWSRLHSRGDDSEEFEDDEALQKESEFDYAFKLRRNKRRIADECCKSTCTYLHMTQYCPRQLTISEIHANINKLVRGRATTELSTNSPSPRTRRPGVIFTDRPARATIFSIESLVK